MKIQQINRNINILLKVTRVKDKHERINKFSSPKNHTQCAIKPIGS